MDSGSSCNSVRRCQCACRVARTEVVGLSPPGHRLVLNGAVVGCWKSVFIAPLPVHNFNSRSRCPQAECRKNSSVTKKPEFCPHTRTYPAGRIPVRPPGHNPNSRPRPRAVYSSDCAPLYCRDRIEPNPRRLPGSGTHFRRYLRRNMPLKLCRVLLLTTGIVADIASQI